MLHNWYAGIKQIFVLAPKLSFISVLLSACTGLLVPVQLSLTQMMVDELLYLISQQTGLGHMVSLTVCFFLTFVLGVLLKLLNSMVSNRLENRTQSLLSEKVLKKLGRIQYAYYEDSSFFDTFERIRNDPGKELCQLYQDTVAVCAVLVELAGIFYILARLSLPFALLYLLILIYITCMGFAAMNQMNTMFDSVTQEERRQNYYDGLLTSKESLYELRVYRSERLIVQKFKEMSDVVLRQRLRGTVAAQKYNLLSNLGIAAWLTSILVFLFLYLRGHGEAIGVFVALLGSVESILSTTETFSSKVSDIAQGSRIGQHLTEFFALKEASCPDQAPSLGALHSIEFQHVYFKYPGSGSYALEDISLTIDPRKSYALVGENGCGKSTMIKLLLGLFQPESGEIYINGCNVNRLSMASLSQVLSAVFQDYGKYQLSVRENLALGELSLLHDDGALRNALRFAQGEQDFPDLDRELGTLDRGTGDVSGGQWQKLAIARACLPKGKYMIFDEPTAALDPKAESELYMQLKRILCTTGCLFVSHRMASAVMSDCIVVMKGHRIVEQGTHDELLKKNGCYAEMFRAQAAAYQASEEGGDIHETAEAD